MNSKRRQNDDDESSNLYQERRSNKKQKFSKDSSPYSDDYQFATHRLSTDSIESANSNPNTGYSTAESSEGEMSPSCFVGQQSFDINRSDTQISDSDSGTSSVASGATGVERKNPANYSSMAQKMMSSMGYKEGKGLGRKEQGIVQPIEASKQRGTRGLGFSIKGLEPMDNVQWDQSKDFIEVREEVIWLENTGLSIPCIDDLFTWVQKGHRKDVIDNEDEFCHPDVLKRVLSNKSIFDKLSGKELINARSRSNPFESIGKLFFLNRAAIKMANLDSITSFMFTTPKDEKGDSLVLNDEVLFFADVCAAPGGFSEYVLWKRKSKSKDICDAKGFGFTLKENDFKLHDFYAAPAEFFEPHYGISGTEGTGDVYDPNNITNFRSFVLKATLGRGLHFMMADGGFSVEGQENIQEILSKRLYLCQFLVALGTVRIGGHFVCKLFDLFTPFSVGLIYLMHMCFENISIHKPNSSRPANSERYIICKHKKECEAVYDYLFQINLFLNQLGEKSKKDIIHIVPIEVLKENKSFYKYIYESNYDLGRRQIIALQKIQAFCQDAVLIDDRQTNLRRDSLEHWGLPDQVRRIPNRKNAKDKAKELLKPEEIRMLVNPPKSLNKRTFEEIRSLFDFRFVILTSAENSRRDKAFFLGLGGRHVYKWDATDSNEWKSIDTQMELPPDTLVYGELLTEYVEESCTDETEDQNPIKKKTAFHLIDGLVLNGHDIRSLHLVERHQLLKKFALCINKPGRKDLATVRCKSLHKLEEIEEVLRPPLLSAKVLPGHRYMKKVFCESQSNSETCYTIPTGIMILKTSKDPWMMAWSKSSQRKYWFHTFTRQARFDTIPEAIALFCDTFSNIFNYWFEPGVELLDGDPLDPNKIQLYDFKTKM